MVKNADKSVYRAGFALRSSIMYFLFHYIQHYQAQKCHCNEANTESASHFVELAGAYRFINFIKSYCIHIYFAFLTNLRICKIGIRAFYNTMCLAASSKTICSSFNFFLLSCPHAPSISRPISLLMVTFICFFSSLFLKFSTAVCLEA